MQSSIRVIVGNISMFRLLSQLIDSCTHKLSTYPRYEMASLMSEMILLARFSAVARVSDSE